MIDYKINTEGCFATRVTYELFDASTLSTKGGHESFEALEDSIFKLSSDLQKGGFAGHIYMVYIKKERAEVGLDEIKTIRDEKWCELEPAHTKIMAFVPTPYEYSKEGETVFVPTVIFGTYLYHLDDEGALTEGRPNRVTLAHYWANPTKKITLRIGQKC